MALTESAVLERYSFAALQQMAKQRNLDVKGESKPSLVSRLASTLYRPDRVQAALADLTPVERRLLDNLVLLGGEAPTGLIYRGLQSEGMIAEPKRTGTYGSVRDQRGSPWQRGSNRFADV